MKPGKKGIALSVEQWNALMAAAPVLEGVLEGMGERVVRPVYDGGEEKGEEDEKGKEDEKGEEGEKGEDDEDEEDE
jgi:TATA-binding protein-associated factor Taf7